MDTGAFNSKIFQMELHTQNETGEGFSGEIRAFNGTVSGTLTNNYSYAVENAAILLYNQLLLTEKLYPHLIEIDETAQSRLEQMMPQLAKDAGATEQLKASDPMRWVGLMNTCKAQAEEILMAELIHS